MTEQTDIYNEFSNFMALLNKNSVVDDITKKTKINHEITCIENDKSNVSTKKTTNKLKCSICKVKINAVDAIISSCKCNKNHCLKHRMPETHNCHKIMEKSNEQKKDLEAGLIKLSACKLNTI